MAGGLGLWEGVTHQEGLLACPKSLLEAMALCLGLCQVLQACPLGRCLHMAAPFFSAPDTGHSLSSMPATCAPHATLAAIGQLSERALPDRTQLTLHSNAE